MGLNLVRFWTRGRVVMGLALLATGLAGCGSSSVFSPLVPSRFIAFGDGFSDLGQVNGLRYTVNDGASNIWLQSVATGYGVEATAQSKGGLVYAQGNARLRLKPDAAGVATTPSVSEQIDAFLSTNAIGQNDVTVINGGLSDIVVQTNALRAQSITPDQFSANVAQAGKDLADQVRRLVGAGGKHVVVVGTYDIGKSPFAGTDTAVISAASLKFNETLLINIADLGANVLYMDAAYYLNLLINQPTSYGLISSNLAACVPVDVTACTNNTIITGADYNKYVFADDKYPTPNVHNQFAAYVINKMRARW